MNPALLFLLARSLRGRLVRALRLLKQPKYVIGVLAFVAWMGLWVGRLFIRDEGGAADIEIVNAELLFAILGDAVPALHLLVSLLLALLLSLWWLIPWSRMALHLDEAELHILTPMPIKRRHLIQYATCKSQPGILFGCLVMSIFLGGGGLLARLGWFASFWLVLTLWDLHSKARAMWLERQKELPAATAWRNRLLLAGGIAAFWVALGTQLSALIADLVTLQRPPDVETLPFLRETMVTYSELLQSTLLAWLLTPFQWITSPLFVRAPGVSTALQLTGLMMPIVLLVAHNEWVVRSRTKFEEAALAHAQRAASKTAPGARYWKQSHASRKRTPFPLRGRGAPEVAILWKNSMIVTRFSYRSLLQFGGGAIGLTVLALFLLRDIVSVLPYVVLFCGLIALLASPLLAANNYRNDLRAELLRLDMVRPWPIEGWKLFAAEAASPAIYGLLTGFAGAVVVLVMDLYFRFLGGDGGTTVNLRMMPEGTAQSLGVPEALLLPLALLSAVPVLVALTFLSTSLQNLVVLLFPAFVQLGNNKLQGAAVAGQNMIMFFGLGLASLVCLLPAALIVGLIVLVQVWAFGVSSINAWELPVLGIIAATPVFAVVALVIRAGGRVWDKLDAAREILQGSA